MNLIGHMLIASNTCDLLEKEYGFVIDRAAFLLGNILPDTSPRMKRPVHRIENWGDRVNELLGDLESGSYGSTRRFSLNLGVACHFISDFFCLAHNDPYYLKQVVHLIYETRQTKEFWRLHHVKSFELAGLDLADTDAVSYLFDKHLEFITQDVSFEKELAFSVEVCAAICGMMISERALVPSGA